MTAAPNVTTKTLLSCALCHILQQQKDGDVELPTHLWNFAAAHGLVYQTTSCSHCQSSTYLYRHSRFRCQKVSKTIVDHKLVTKQCNFDISALKGTFFEYSDLSLKKSLYLCYCFVQDTATYNEVLKRVKVPLNRLNYWYSLCQELIISYCLRHSRKIGGLGKTVKITEAKVCKKGSNRTSTKEQWVLGGFEEKSRSFFLVFIPNHRKETLAKCIRKCILPGTEIISDSWENCSSLSFEDYVHKTLHHPVNHDIPESSATPENTEQQLQGSCHSAKISILAQEKSVGQLALLYFKLTFPDVLERFHQLLVLAAKLFPPQKGLVE